MTRLDVELCFERLRQLCECNNWEVQEKNEDGIIASRVGGPASNTCVVRLTREVQATFEAKLARMRPEFFATISTNVLKCSVLEVVAPGDAILMVLLQDRQNDSSLRFLGGTPQSLVVCHEARISLRRDFPQPCMASSVCIPMMSDSMAAADLHTKPRWVYFTVMEASDQDGRLRLHTYFEVPWPVFPVWSVPYFRNLLQFEKRVDHECPPEMYRLAEEYYVVLTLRSCTRGPPLLPGDSQVRDIDAGGVTVGNYLWNRVPSSNFNFAAYLSRFLQLAGMPAPVHNSLDGRRLVGYQAVLWVQDWKHCHAQFEAMFSTQQTAYRLLNGGKNAPKIRDCVTPRFRAYSAYDIDTVFSEVLCTRNTFLELRSVPAIENNVTIRSAECPERVAQEWSPASMRGGGSKPHEAFCLV